MSMSTESLQKQNHLTTEPLPQTSFAAEKSIPKQEQDATKVSPYYLDTVSVHPDSLQKLDESSNKISPQGSVKASDRPPSTDELLTQLYDTAQWVWGLIMPHFDTDNADNKSPTAGPATTNKDLFTLEERQKFVEEMRKLIERIKTLTDEEFSDLEYLITEMYKAQIQVKEEQSHESKQKLIKEQANKREISQERLDKLNDIATSVSKSNIWGLFEKGASTLGLAAVGVGVSSAWGTLGFIIAIGLVADQCFEDPLKKQIVSFVTNDPETENRWLERIKLGCGLATLGIFASLGAQSFQTLFSASMNISKGTAIGVKGIIDHDMNNNSADIKELTNDAIKADDKIKKEVGSIKNSIGNIYDYYRNIAQIHKAQNEMTLGLYR